MGGVSGAFLLLPFQVSVLGYTSPSVSATNQLFNIVATPGGIFRYAREGRLLWPLAVSLIVGTLPGVFLGAWIRVFYLPEPRRFLLFAGSVLILIGIRLLADLFRRESKPLHPGQIQSLSNVSFTWKKVEFTLGEQSFEFSPWRLFLLSTTVGVVGGTYGIGGGAIIAPFLVVFFRIPVYALAGATLTATFATSVAGVGAYEILAAYNPGLSVAPDWLLGSLFGLGGLCGTYFGGRCQRHVPSWAIKLILCLGILFVGTRYVWGFWK